MRRTTLLSVGLALGLASACTDADRSFLILQNQIPEGCIPPASDSSDFRPRGRIDVQAASGYLFFPLVLNLVDSGGRPGENLIQVQGADIDLTFQEGFFADDQIPAEIEPFLALSERFSGVIEAGGGLTAFSFIIIPRDLLEAVKDLGRLEPDGRNSVPLLAKVEMFGTLDGGEVQSQPYEYVVDVCDGCLKRNVGACSELPQGFAASPGGECNLLQDVVLECCTLAGGGERCPATLEVVEP